MAIELKSTKDVHLDGVKILVYGQSGVGKTRLIATAPKPIIISAESGLLSLAECDIPVIEITTLESLKEAFDFCKSDACAEFETICIDSLTEIGEVVLTNAKKMQKDVRKAYGDLIEEVTQIVKGFRDMRGKNVYFSAQEGKEKNADVVDSISPEMPGSKVGGRLPYWFDEVFRLEIMEFVNDAGETKKTRVLRTSSDGICKAKDRSGKLEEFERANLSKIITKIKGGK